MEAGTYGRSRDRYAHVLSTFKHTSHTKAPELCLARFDELKSIGLDTFTKKHDPFWDIPLNENLPQPVIDLPGCTKLARMSASNSTRPVASRSGRGEQGIDWGSSSSALFLRRQATTDLERAF